MAKQNWKSIDLMDVIGMASNPVNPGTKFAKRLLNVYAHEKPGALTLRPGYAPKYTAPSDSTITSSEFINFGVFFDRQADLEGQEIICEIQKGIVTALRDDLDQPIVANTFQGLQFWVRPYWDGAQWLNNWQWVNKTIITKITDEDAAYPSKIKIYGNLSHGLGNDSLIGWTIYNLTKNQYARIITCKIESPGLWLNVSLYDNVWEFDDVIICSRCWIDIDAQLEFFNNVEKEDIVFHRINHDLRIGFGGKENRPGLMLGYRKTYLQLGEINFTQKDPALLESDAIEKFSKTEGIILTTNIIDLDGSYGMDISSEAGGNLSEGTVYLKLVGILDEYSKQLVAESEVAVATNDKIKVLPFIQLGRANPRITKLELYWSDDDITFWKLRDYEVAGSELNPSNWEINELGRFITNPDEDKLELHTESNAASITAEINSVGSWGVFDIGSINSEAGGAGGSLYSLKLTSVNTAFMKFPLSGILRNVNYDISFYIKSDILITAHVVFVGASGNYLSRPMKILGGITNTFVQKNIALNSGDSSEEITHILIGAWVSYPLTQWELFVDLVSIKSPDKNYLFELDLVKEATMDDEMGYTPTYDLVKGWDFVVIKDGRVYYFNPFVEERKENFVLVSAIAPPNTFMWDIASFANFRELEKYDSNETIGAELLPNKEILILKDASVTTLIDDGRVGITREPVYGVDCISRVSIVNINGLIFWCGKEEIYLLNAGRSLVPQPLLKDTIRDLYLAIEDKSKIFGTRNRFNTYRIRIDDAEQKIEYLFTEDGWVEERKWHFPEIYRGGFNNKLYFLNAGNIYEEQVDFSLPGLPYGEE